VSIYLAQDAGRQARQVATRLERLLACAEHELRAQGMGSAEAATLLEPARAFAAGLLPPGGGGRLALFAAPGFFRVVRGDFQAAEELEVGPRFHLRPLLPLLGQPERFYVLALSLNHVRLIEATPAGTRRLPLGELEGSFVDAMGYDEYYAGLQVHSAGARGGGAARRPAVVHGHGDHDEEKLEEDLRHWLRRVADAVRAKATDRRARRVLATAVEHASPYLAASRDPLLLPTTVAGNPDRLSDDELAARAKPLVETALAEERREALELWRERLGGDRASGDLAVVLRLARQGRVQALFLPAAVELWGTHDDATGRLELHAERRAGDEELLERAALETLEHGGDVYEVRDDATLDGAPLAALLRG
jgi:hypothetical protein